MYFCGTDLYSYYKNNLADVSKALSRNILPLGRIVAFTQPAAGKDTSWVPLRRSGERLRTRHADPLYAAARAHDRSCGHGTHPRRHGGRRARRTFRAPSGLPRKGMVAGIDRKFVVAAQQRPSRRRSVAERYPVRPKPAGSAMTGALHGYFGACRRDRRLRRAVRLPALRRLFHVVGRSALRSAPHGLTTSSPRPARSWRTDSPTTR